MILLEYLHKVNDSLIRMNLIIKGAQKYKQAKGNWLIKYKEVG